MSHHLWWAVRNLSNGIMLKRYAAKYMAEKALKVNSEFWDFPYLQLIPVTYVDLDIRETGDGVTTFTYKEVQPEVYKYNSFEGRYQRYR